MKPTDKRTPDYWMVENSENHQLHRDYSTEFDARTMAELLTRDTRVPHTIIECRKLATCRPGKVTWEELE